MINQNEMLFKLNYTLIQLTSSRVVLEIKQLKTFNQQINMNSRLIYSLIHLNTNVPISRGSIDMSQPKHASVDGSTHPERFFLAVEGLQPNTSYLFLAYLKTNLNNDASYVQLVANRTFTTPARPFTPIQNASSIRESRLSEDEFEDEGYTQ